MRRIDRAFKVMRHMGLVAYQNYQCCAGCAGTAITTEVERRLDQGTPREDIKGVVFYHKQDAEVLRDGGLLGKTLCIRYGDCESQKYGIVGMETAVVGHLVTQALAVVGIKYSWNRNPLSVIEADAISCCEPWEKK